ncbi:MAG: GerMN domain-containing protein [Acidimicrobiia bacterium]
MRIRRSLLAAVAALVLAGACTVPTNEEPVELSGSIVPETTTTTSTTIASASNRDVVVYLLATIDGTTTLRPVPRSVELGSGVQGVLANLFSQRPSNDRDAEVGLSTAIPEGASLLSADVDPDDPDRLVVDVRGLFGSEGVQGAQLRDALAQIVWTATEGESGINEVVFRQDGQPRPALVDNLESTTDAVRRRDYSREN